MKYYNPFFITVLGVYERVFWFDRYSIKPWYSMLQVTFSPPPRVSYPDMHNGERVMHVPWCMSGLLTRGFHYSRWRGKRSLYSWCMRNPQFNVSVKSPTLCILKCMLCNTRYSWFHRAVLASHWILRHWGRILCRNHWFTTSLTECSRVYLMWLRNVYNMAPGMPIYSKQSILYPLT